MLPYTAIDLITAMDRTYGFADAPHDSPRASCTHALRRSRQIIQAAAITMMDAIRR